MTDGDLTPQERAEIEALLGRGGAEDEDEDFVAEPIGPVRRVLRWLLRLVCLAVAGLIGWHLLALSSLPDKPFDAVHAPIVLTIGSGLAGMLFLLWFDGRLRRVLLLLLALAALAVSGLSMRWVDSSRSGIREYWAGVERQRMRLGDDLCYTIDGKTFVLRGAGGGRFAYMRGIWPGAFGEAEFRRYFFSDLPMAADANGWTCAAR
jgi:hypothetical protein